MTKNKKILTISISVLAVLVISVVLFLALKTKVFPSMNKYEWSYKQVFADPHDADMKIDGVLDEARWSKQEYLTHTEYGVTTKYTTIFTKYGLYIGAMVEDENFQWNARYNFSRGNSNPGNSAFHFRISQSDVTEAQTFNTYNFYVDAKDTASRNQTRFEAESTINGNLFPEHSENRATQMTAEFFVSWDALHISTDGADYPENIRIFPEYRHVVKTASSENRWIYPTCYENNNTRMFASGLFGKDGYINVDKDKTLLGDAKNGISKSDGWNLANVKKGEVISSEYYNQAIFYKEVCSNAYAYSTTIKITDEMDESTGGSGICNAIDQSNINVLYISAQDVLDAKDKLQIYKMEYTETTWTTQLLGEIPNKPAYKTGGIPVTVLKKDGMFFYIVDGKLFYCEEISYLERESCPGLFSTNTKAEFSACTVTDYSKNTEELDKLISNYVYTVKTPGRISGGTVSSDVMAIPKVNGKASEDLKIRIAADTSYILTKLTIQGTNSQSSDYFSYAASNMKNGILTIPKEKIVDNIVIEAQFTSFQTLFQPSAYVVVTGDVKNIDEVGQVVDMQVIGKGINTSLLYCEAKSGGSGKFELYLLKKGTYTIPGGITIRANGKYSIGVSNDAYVAHYKEIDTASNTENVHIVMNKNRMLAGFTEIDNGQYKSSIAHKHSYFINGLGTEWVSKVSLPAIKDTQMAGLVLRDSQSHICWIRIVGVIRDGELNILAHLNVDNQINIQKYYPVGISADDIEGKVLQVVYRKGRLSCYLDTKLVFAYGNDLVIDEHRVEEVLNLERSLYCGLYASAKDIVFKDWSYATKNVPVGRNFFPISGVIAADTATKRLFKISAVNTKSGDIFTTSVAADGTFSMRLPQGQYTFQLSSNSQTEFFYKKLEGDSTITVTDKSIENIKLKAKKVHAAISSLNVKLDIPLADVKADEFVIKLQHEEYGEIKTARNEKGVFTAKAPVGTYTLSIKHNKKSKTFFMENRVQVTVKNTPTNETVEIRKNTINSKNFSATKDGVYEYVFDGYNNSRFYQGSGTSWMAEVKVPQLEAKQGVGFVLINNKDGVVNNGKWMRISIEELASGYLRVFTRIHSDKTATEAAVDITASYATNVKAADAEGKMLYCVFNNGVVTMRLGDKIIALYGNETRISSVKGTTLVKAMLDLTNNLQCGLTSTTKGMVISDWVFTNVPTKILSNPKVNGTLTGKVTLSISQIPVEQMKIMISRQDGSLEYCVNPAKDGSYQAKLPIGKYTLSIVNDGKAAYLPYSKTINISERGVVNDITLTSKNVIDSKNFSAKDDNTYEYVFDGYNNSRFNYGNGTSWMAELKIPELEVGQGVGFVAINNKDGVINNGKWMRFSVEELSNGYLRVFTRIHSDKTETEKEIDITASYVTTVKAADAEGKKLYCVFNNDVLTMRVEDKIVALYSNETRISSIKGTTLVKDILDVTNNLHCGLTSATKGMIITDWAYTNIKKNVLSNPKANGTVSGKVTLSINQIPVEQMKIMLAREDGSLECCVNPATDGSYQAKLPTGKYTLSIVNDGKAAYLPYSKTIDVSEQGVIHDITLTSKNVIDSKHFSAKKDNTYEYTYDGYNNSRFNYGDGTSWMAKLKIPELEVGQGVGFVAINNKDGVINNGKWMRCSVEELSNGYLRVLTRIHSDKTATEAEIDITTSYVTTVKAADAEGKTLYCVFNNDVLTVRVEEEIVALYSNETRLSSTKGTTLVKDVLDLTNNIHCGLTCSVKGMIISDWAYSNIAENVLSNPKANGKLSGKVTLSISQIPLEQMKIMLAREGGSLECCVNPATDGSYQAKLPAGKYTLSIVNDGKAAYLPYSKTIEVSEQGVIHDITLTSKNVIDSKHFSAKSNNTYEYVFDGYNNSRFNYGDGTAWMAELKIPELASGQGVGFVVINNKDGVVNNGKWMRVSVEEQSNGNLRVFTRIHSDKTNTEAEVDITTSHVTTMKATEAEGKTLYCVFNNGMITVRVDDKILALYTNDTRLSSAKGTTAVKEILDLTNNLQCGLTCSTKGMIVSEWAYTNIAENVLSNPELKGNVSGKMTLSISQIPVEQVKIILKRVDGSFECSTYPATDGSYSAKLPVGKYVVTILNDGKAAYLPYSKTIDISEQGVVNDITLTSKNVINSNYFSAKKDNTYEYTYDGYNNSRFNYGDGTAWMAELRIPELASGQGIGFVVINNKDGRVNNGKWMRVSVEEQSNGNLRVLVRIHRDKTDTEEKIDITASHASGMKAADAEGKTLYCVFNNDMITLRVGDKIIASYTNDTEISSTQGTTSVQDILDLTNNLQCGLTCSTKGMIVSDWAYTNIEKNVLSNPNPTVNLLKTKYKKVGLMEFFGK